ncbi:hypothetical protein ACTXT7_010150 [Hymenolepis weldensis]
MIEMTAFGVRISRNLTGAIDIRMCSNDLDIKFAEKSAILASMLCKLRKSIYPLKMALNSISKIIPLVSAFAKR